MAFSEILAERLREALKHLPVEEKKMFGSLAFMINGKMCLNAGAAKMMCRIDPNLHDQEVKRAGCSTVTMGGWEYRGYIEILEENLRNGNDFNHWLHLALDFNKQLIVK